jgi:hypothetical protein
MKGSVQGGGSPARRPDTPLGEEGAQTPPPRRPGAVAPRGEGLIERRESQRLLQGGVKLRNGLGWCFAGAGPSGRHPGPSSVGAPWSARSQRRRSRGAAEGREKVERNRVLLNGRMAGDGGA